MTSIFDNGGLIGRILDFNSTERYTAGFTTGPATIEYVGGRTQSFAGSTSNYTVSLTSLTGGLAASPAENDIVIIAIEMCGTTNKSYRISGYEQIVDLYANSTEDSNFQVGYKVMGSTPDTSATITGGSGATADATSVVVQVWRNVDLTTPLDVTPVTNFQTSTGIPNPPAITPSSEGSMIIVAAGTAHTGGTDTYTAGYLSNFRTVGSNGTNDSTIGMGSILWDGTGPYDPAAWGWSQADSGVFSHNAVTFALRPATVETPILGNYQNSGIWNAKAVWNSKLAPPSIFGPDVFAAWDPNSGGNASGFVEDAVGSIPLWVRDQSTTVTNWDGIFNDRELLIIDGSDAQASITSNTNISVSFWYNWYSVGSNPSNGSPIMAHGNGWPGDGATTNGSFQIASDFNGAIGLYIHYSGFSSSGFSSAGILTRNTWHFITLTAGPGGWRIYVNGSLVVNLGSVDQTLPSINRVFVFGAVALFIENTQTSHNDTFSNHYDYYWAGTIGDIRMHNKILSDAEVSALYALGRQSY